MCFIVKSDTKSFFTGKLQFLLLRLCFFQFCFLLQNLVTFWRQKLKEMRNFWKNKKKCFLGNFKILWKFFLLSMYLNAMYGAVRDRRCLWIVPKTDQKISIMNILNDNLTHNASIPPKRFLALFNWKSTYFLILHGNFTRDTQKYQLWVKICEFDPKIVSNLFKSVLRQLFFCFMRKKKKKMQKFYNRPNLGHFW